MTRSWGKATCLIFSVIVISASFSSSRGFESKATAAKRGSKTKNDAPSQQEPADLLLGERENAVCFVGQFLRYGTMKVDVHSIFGPGIYDAYVAMSTQQDEADPSPVSAEEICENLQLTGHFRSCYASLSPYNGSAFVEMTTGLGFQLGNGLYPHRMASFFSTIQRCVRMVGSVHRRSLIHESPLSLNTPQDWAPRSSAGHDELDAKVLVRSHPEGTLSESNVPLSGSAETHTGPLSAAKGVFYRTVFVTRLDVVNLLHVTKKNSGHPPLGARWWAQVDKFDAVAERFHRGTPKARLEDRIFFGKAATMLKFESVFDDFLPHWASSLPPNGDDPCPEWLLWRYLLKDKATGREDRSLAVGKNTNFISVDHFKSADEKYQTDYRDQLLNGLGMNSSEVGGLLRCSDFKTPWAKAGCEASSSSSRVSSKGEASRHHQGRHNHPLTDHQHQVAPPAALPTPTATSTTKTAAVAAAASSSSPAPKMRRVCSSSSSSVACWDQVDPASVQSAPRFVPPSPQGGGSAGGGLGEAPLPRSPHAARDELARAKPAQGNDDSGRSWGSGSGGVGDLGEANSEGDGAPPPPPPHRRGRAGRRRGRNGRRRPHSPGRRPVH